MPRTFSAVEARGVMLKNPSAMRVARVATHLEEGRSSKGRRSLFVPVLTAAAVAAMVDGGGWGCGDGVGSGVGLGVKPLWRED